MQRADLYLLPSEIRLVCHSRTREVFVNDDWLNPAFSKKLRNHSPDGFNWGYGGSGPAQLALAIMLKFLDNTRALELYQHFKSSVIAALPEGDIDTTIYLRKEIENIISSADFVKST